MAFPPSVRICRVRHWRITSASGPLNLATEINARDAVIGPRTLASLVHLSEPASAEPRGIADTSRSERRGRPKVSAQADRMAVWGVGCELVSGVRSLIRRENTGKFTGFAPGGDPRCRNSIVVPGSWNRIPCEHEQGIISGEQGTLGAKQGIKTPCS